MVVTLSCLHSLSLLSLIHLMWQNNVDIVEQALGLIWSLICAGNFNIHSLQMLPTVMINIWLRTLKNCVQFTRAGFVLQAGACKAYWHTQSRWKMFVCTCWTQMQMYWCLEHHNCGIQPVNAGKSAVQPGPTATRINTPWDSRETLFSL